MQFGVFVAVVRGLLDGVFARDCRGAVGGSAGGSFGWNRGSRRGFEHFVQVCTGMKAQGIEIHVLQAEGNPDFDAYARQCATSAQTHHRVKDAESVKLALRNITPAGGEILRLVR